MFFATHFHVSERHFLTTVKIKSCLPLGVNMSFFLSHNLLGTSVFASWYCSFFFYKVLLKDTSVYSTALNMFFILKLLFSYISIHCKIHLVPLTQHRSCINPRSILLSQLNSAAVTAWQSSSHLVSGAAASSLAVVPWVCWDTLLSIAPFRDFRKVWTQIYRCPWEEIWSF